MEYLNQIVQSTEITWQTALLRIVFSFIIGTLIGIEREAHSQPAGLRTHILISIGATLVMLISIYIPQTFTRFQNGDPGRIAAQVVSGIGFLGAGVILKFGADVKGLTTAASIWVMAAIGLAIGAGMYSISIIGVVVVLLALVIMDIFERRIFKERTLKKIELLVKKKDSDLEELKKLLTGLDVRIVSSGIERNVNEATSKITFLVAVSRKLNIQLISNALEQHPGMVAISVEMIE
ncbi:MAG: MgtC/SapB family protein [Prolixibacteraceae bacterium]|nr:MgtC/SapB family protein [Prolixibacteraceae bacterium]